MQQNRFHRHTTRSNTSIYFQSSRVTTESDSTTGFSSSTWDNVVRFIRERKKLLILSVFAYLVVMQFMYTGRWQLRAVITKPAAVGRSLLINMWNTHELNEVDRLLRDIKFEKQDLTAAVRRLRAAGDRDKPLIAVGGGITSKHIPPVNLTNIASVFQFLQTLLPTFCLTADRMNFNYVFYLAFDESDLFFTNLSLADAFRRTFDAEVGRLCAAGFGGSIEPSNLTYHATALVSSVVLVRCQHAGTPTRAQNDAMLAAYVDGADFFYRINDDTKLVTGDWAQQFVGVLDGYSPPRVGVVGPNHWGGNTGILTYDFVHRTHVEIFGFYYPWLFSDWWGDNWITNVYKPNRSTKLNNIRLAHTMALGQRYGVNFAVEQQLVGQIARDQLAVARYVEAINSAKFSTQNSGRKVVAMSLHGSNPRFTWGAIRNAQLLPVILPDWTLRVYVAAPAAEAVISGFPSSSSHSPSELMAVPTTVLNTLKKLGAEIAWVPVPIQENHSPLTPHDWRLLAADDNNIDFLLIRDADHRLTDRESTAIDEWIAAAESGGMDDVATVHCFRDHPKHAGRALTDGLWAARPAALRRHLGSTANSSSVALLVATLRASNDSRLTGSNQSAESIVLNDVVWPAVNEHAFCHDSVSVCGQWLPLSSRKAFRNKTPSGDADAATGARNHYVGQKFNEHEVPLNDDWKSLSSDDLECDGLVRITRTTIHASTAGLLTTVPNAAVNAVSLSRNPS